METYAVLTGDLVGSRDLGTDLRAEVIRWLKRLADDFEGVNRGALAGDPEVFRGDGWQVCLRDPARALTAAVFFRAGLKAHRSGRAIDSRVGIGIGPVDRLVEKRVSESSGPVFVSSGAALDSLGGALRLRLNWPGGGDLAELLNAALLPLLDLEVSRWTHAESVAAYGALMGWTQQQTADHPLARKKDGKQPTRQAIQNALARIFWHSHFQPALERAESLLRNNPNIKQA